MKTTKRTLLLIGLVLVAATACAENTHHGTLTANGSLYFRAEPLNNFIQSKSKELYYYVHLQGIKKEDAQSTSRLPLNLSIVIDRSGSMEGNKLAYTKEAVKYIVNQLGNRDILSIVLYDTDVEVFYEPQRVENKKELLKKIDDIRTLNSTNLEGGIRKGYELVRSSQKLVGGEMISRVLLLSDGLANVGLTDPESLSGITRNFFESNRVSISTFGVGMDYNEDLMAKMAVQGGGKYYFIDSPEKMPSVFNDELKGISQVVAKNTVLKIKFPDDQLAFEKTYVYNSNKNKNELEINFNDIFSEEQKSVLIKFSVKGKITSPLLMECSLVYSNSKSNSDTLLAISDVRKSEIKLTADDKEYSSGFNRAAGEGHALQVSGELYEEAVQAGNLDNYEQSRDKIKQAKEVLSNHFKTFGEHPFLKDLYAKFVEYENIIGELKNMDREKVRFYIKHNKHKKFRTVASPSF